MAYNEELEARVTAATTDWGTTRKKMFGGTAHLLNGNMLCGVYKDYLGPVNTHLIDALLPQMGPGKARGGRLVIPGRQRATRHGLHLGRNPRFGENPVGRGRFCAIQRCSSPMWDDHVAFAAPWLAPKRSLAHRLNMY